MNGIPYLLACLALLTTTVMQGAPLAPDDPSISDNLCLWLRSADVNFDPATGVWTDVSGRGNDAKPAGEVAAYGITYVGPTLSFGSNPNVFDHEFAAVKFDGQVDDLMRATGLNGGVGLSELTIVTVYKDYNYDESNRSITRPLGFGSISGEGLNMGDNFNVANDVSIRKDNGSVGGATATVPQDQFFIRAARMDPGAINQWFNTDGTFVQVHDVAGSSYTTSTDNFYLGDLRAGNSTTIGASFSRTDIEIAEVVVYNAALTEAQIEGISEWLRANVRYERKTAFVPTPADGALVEMTFVMLEWLPGATAASHQVYFGENLDDVSKGVVEPAVTTEAKFMAGFAPPYLGGLTPGQTYYWRVDEIEADGVTVYPGDVWSFRLRPQHAWAPSPADGIPYVHPEQDLSWEVGLGAFFHTVYFGASFEEVNDAVAGGAMTVEALHDPGTMESNTTYYWRVDEFDGVATYTGDVWSFTTVPDVAVTDPNLVGWWTFDEGAGTTAVDWSGHSHHGQIRGAAIWGPGHHDGALTFRDDVYVETTGYAGVTGTHSRTCCAWIKTTSANRNIMSWGELAAGQKWRIRIDSTGGLRAEVEGGSNYGWTNVADGRWHHVTVVLEDDGSPDATETLLYVDGKLDGSAASVDEPIDTADSGVVRIGESPWHNTAFIGQIDDVRIYDKVLTEEEIQQVMRGDPLLAWSPEPARDAMVDIREAASLSWMAGDTAASHDVYLGVDRNAVAAAGRDSAEYKGNQPGTNLSLAGLVEFGGGDYYWRIDEVEADGTTIHMGPVWMFTIPDYLIVDDFESYTDEVGSRIFQTWIDGFGYTEPEIVEGNGTGSTVGNISAPFAERTIVNSGNQSMPLAYDNSLPPYYSEAERTWPAPQDWTVGEVDTLTLYFRGASDNGPDDLYVAIEDHAGKVAVAVNSDPNAVLTTSWTEWDVPLSSLTGAGVNVTAVKAMYIGVGNRDNPVLGGIGILYIDDIRITKDEAVATE